MRKSSFSSGSTLSIAFSGVARGIKEGLSTHRFAASEEKEVVEFFFPDGTESCVFCGDNVPDRWDHLVPISEGGETVIGNVVPSCQPCDDSKQHRDFAKWMLGSAPQSPITRNIPGLEKRIDRLKEYMKAFGYQPKPLIDRLTVEEWQQYQQLLNRLRQLRRDIEQFITAYQQTHS